MLASNVTLDATVPPPRVCALPSPVGFRLVDIGLTRRPLPVRPSQRTADVALRFGVSQHDTAHAVVASATLPLVPGRVVLIVGPSGSGKSSALAAIQRQFAAACLVQHVAFPRCAAVIDAVAPEAPLGEAISLLTACGLGEPRLWLRPLAVLSDGERFRARLARGIALHERSASQVPILVDEFCAGLHDRLARAVAFNLCKLAARRKLCVVVAMPHDGLAAELHPHTIVRLSAGGPPRFECPTGAPPGAPGFARRLRIEPGSKRDYHAFAAMHYRDADELGFVDQVFLLRAGSDGDVLGIVVYAHAPLELSLRNQATAGWFSRRPDLVNEHLRILRRLVIHPDVRGCGLGHFLVRRTLPRLGTPFVECLAAMGEFNPVFEKAGMTPVGQYPSDPRRRLAFDALCAIDVDPYGPDFETRVARRRDVRAIVAGALRAWYAGTTGGGEGRVARQSPEFLARTFRGLVGARPVYYLWRAEVPVDGTPGNACVAPPGNFPHDPACDRSTAGANRREAKQNPFEPPRPRRRDPADAILPPSLLRNPSGARRAARPRRGHAGGTSAAGSSKIEVRRSKSEPREEASGKPPPFSKGGRRGIATSTATVREPEISTVSVGERMNQPTEGIEHDHDKTLASHLATAGVAEGPRSPGDGGRGHRRRMGLRRGRRTHLHDPRRGSGPDSRHRP